MSEVIVYSADPDAERLHATTVAEAVEAQVDQWEHAPTPDDEIAVTSYRRMELPSRDLIAAQALDSVLEWLDDEHGDPDGDTGLEAMPRLHDDALTFADRVRAEYKSWACEPVETFTVLVREYVPGEWIEEES